MYTDWCIAVSQPPALDYPDCYLAYPEMLRDVSINFNDYLGFINSKTILPYTDMNAYPDLSGVVYIDCIPLLAILVKTIILTIPALNNMDFINFQYIGIVGAVNFILQGLLAFIIIKKITKTNYINALLGSLFFVIAPITLERFPVHFALTSQWLILASFLPFLYYKNRSKKVMLLYWFVLGFSALGIQPYFVVTTAFVAIAFSFYVYFKYDEKKLSWCFLPISILGSILAFCFTGGVGNAVSATTETYWFNLYSFNLNSFFNPTISENFFFATVFSFLNGKLPIRDVCNWEGFSYLGAGIIIPLVAIIAYCLYFLPKKSFQDKYRDFLKKYKVEIAVFVSFFFLTLLYSCSFVITFNELLLVKIPVPEFIEKCLSVFRAPGRVIWADFFLIYFFVICFLLKKFKPVVSTCILGTLFIVQAVDLSVFFKIYRSFFSQKVVYSSPLKNEGWNIIKQGKKYVFIRDFDGKNVYLLRDVHYWSIKNGLKCNSVLSSRLPVNREETMKNRILNPQNEDLFIFFKHQSGEVKKYPSLENCYLLDDYIVCAKENHPDLNKYKLSNKMKIKQER